MRFSNMIKKHSKPYTVIKETAGHFDGPIWVPGTIVTYTNVNLAIMNLTPQNIKYYEGGNYTTQDLKVLAPEILTGENAGVTEDITLAKGDIVVFGNENYEIEEFQNRTIHADYYEYVARKVVVESA